MLSKKYKEAFEKINNSKKILLVTHNRPDGDALSSICSVIELLLNLNKKFFAYCYDQPPHQFNFLPHTKKIRSDINELSFAEYDLIIALDCGSLARTCLAKEILSRNDQQFVIEFDHHPKTDDYADLEIRIPEASSTVEILYNFFKTNQIKINKNIANCILAGILTDTGNFLYPSTTEHTIKISSKMLQLGARFPTVLENTWRNKSLAAMKIWGKALNNLQINSEYNFAFSVLAYEDISGTDVTEEELEGISGFLSNLHEVKGLLFIREEEKGKIKGSLRTTRHNVNVSKLARYLGGGGHAKASGFIIKGNLEKTNGGWMIK